uniref:Cytochrome P450 n=1 Tax=Streptomyces sp. NBC_00003 TaxID=2903608 RepID=A0AAU2UW88_9ACTN
MRVVCELFGVAEELRQPLCSTLGVVFDTVVSAEEMAAAQVRAFAMLGELVAGKRVVRQGDDLTSALIAVQDNGDALTEDELLGALYLMIAAGQETTSAVITNAIGALCARPEQLEHVRADRADWSDVMSETLHTHSPTVSAVLLNSRGRASYRRLRPQSTSPRSCARQLSTRTGAPGWPCVPIRSWRTRPADGSPSWDCCH